MNRKQFLATVLGMVVLPKFLKAQPPPKILKFTTVEDMDPNGIEAAKKIWGEPTVFWIKNRRGGQTLMVHKDHEKEYREYGELVWKYWNSVKLTPEREGPINWITYSDRFQNP